MINTFVILGGRPQIIKAYPLLRNKKFKKLGINFIIVDTGQHYSKSLSEDLFTDLSLEKPEYKLNCPKAQPIKQIAFIIKKLEKLIDQLSPDSAVVFGDMNSTLASSIALSKKNIPIIHVEAGTRSRNLRMAEERNRIITDHLSSVLLAPDEDAVKNLSKEHLASEKSLKRVVANSDDIMLESLRLGLKIEKKGKNQKDKFSLLTLHRNENLISKPKLRKIFKALGEHKQNIIFPLHPHTKKILNNLSIKLPKNVIIRKPANYIELIGLVSSCQMVFTDSGGLQKEACWLGKPCVILRDETEKYSLIRDRKAVFLKNYHKDFRFKQEKELNSRSTSLYILKNILRLAKNR